jgi:hypothetical protein
VALYSDYTRALTFEFFFSVPHSQKVQSIAAMYSKYTRALTFENFHQENFEAIMSQANILKSHTAPTLWLPHHVAGKYSQKQAV